MPATRPDLSVGDAAQTRAIIEQAISAMAARVLTTDEIDERVNRRIDEKFNAMELKLKHWVIFNVLINILALIPVVFFLGGIYFQNQAAMADIGDTKVVLAERAEWMSARERWEQAIEAWAAPAGFRPPRDRAVSR